MVLTGSFDNEETSYMYDYMYPTQYWFPSYAHRPEELFSPNLILYEDDLSSVSSDISLVSEDDTEDEVWDLRDYPCPVADYREHSLTIEVYDRERIAGDTLWFRVSHNGKAGYCEYEDKEILGFVQSIIESNPDSCFYVKHKFSGGDDEPVSFFESRYIPYVLLEIMRLAKHFDEIRILYRPDPALDDKKKAENKCFLSWLSRLPFGHSDRKPAYIEI